MPKPFKMFSILTDLMSDPVRVDVDEVSVPHIVACSFRASLVDSPRCVFVVFPLVSNLSIRVLTYCVLDHSFCIEADLVCRRRTSDTSFRKRARFHSLS